MNDPLHGTPPGHPRCLPAMVFTTTPPHWEEGAKNRFHLSYHILPWGILFSVVGLLVHPQLTITIAFTIFIGAVAQFSFGGIAELRIQYPNLTLILINYN